MKQITVTEHNEWEGETFSYILNVDDEMLEKIKSGISDYPELDLDENTDFTPDLVKRLNKSADNGYMPRYEFYEICLPEGDFEWYHDVFYKGVGLNRIRE